MSPQREATDEWTRIRTLTEKLLILVESLADNALDDAKSRQKLRRDLMERLDEIEGYITRRQDSSSEDPAVLRKSEAVTLVKHSLPYFLAALTTASGWLYHFIRH